MNEKAARRQRFFGWFGDGHKYAPINKRTAPSARWTRKHSSLTVLALAGAGILFLVLSRLHPGSSSLGVHRWSSHCDSVYHGFECRPEISHFWGQYSPFFTVNHSDGIPIDCELNFAQLLSRATLVGISHGARDPTYDKTNRYHATIQKLQANVDTFTGKYAFLTDYRYSLGADQLTPFGEQQLVNSGMKFYDRYWELTSEIPPFVRASGQNRVVQSAYKWTEGFLRAKEAHIQSSNNGSEEQPWIDVILSEEDGAHNPLSHGLCDEFEKGAASHIGSQAQSEWALIFVPPIQARLNQDLVGADLTPDEVIHLMDLCPFNTVAMPEGTVSAFCDLFDEDEWHYYNYFQTLGKYYGYSHGNPLGPTQGIGFVNELLARLNQTDVIDNTSTNHTLDRDPATFPLDRQLYADFTHDNDMIAILSALRLYEALPPLSNTSMLEAREAEGFSSAWTIPFAARVYIEKMKCEGYPQFIRILVNDRIVPMPHCDSDSQGRCTREKFLESMDQSRWEGEWDRCFR